MVMKTDRVVLRGTDRNKVVVDGEFRRGNGITVTGAQSVVENLTVRNHLVNGVLFTGVTDTQLQARRAGGAGLQPARHPRKCVQTHTRPKDFTPARTSLAGQCSRSQRDPDRSIAAPRLNRTMWLPSDIGRVRRLRFAKT
ncbi:hypothetical protein ACH4SP_12460 [Streptomyces sp. NPDC021093]|uniref:hypothetical protein n=1 Tax=Streptomyces sp. NPDC021093 TaxID=3365112 RepID=UPI00378CF46E